MFTTLMCICILTSVRPVRNQLIRPVAIYQDIIDGIHDYFNNTCIILLHATTDPIGTQGLTEGMQLQKLQAYLSGRHIRTTSMDFKTFKTQVGYSYFHIKRPLFVLLNDSEDVKRDFTDQLTGWIDMSYPTWLIFFRDQTTIEDFFKEIYVPFDCTFMVAQGDSNDSSTEIITEVYQVDPSERLRHSVFGSWHPDLGMTTPKLGLYQRRNDLFGKIIRVASIEDPPGSVIIRDKNGKMIGLEGVFGGIMQLLEKKMNCTLTYHESKDWGYYLENGTWTGVVGLLNDDVVDIVAAGLMMTGSRLEAIEFTTPLYSTKCRTYIKRPLSPALKWKAYISPFHTGIWSSIGILIIVTSGTISLVKWIVPIVSELQDIENSPSSMSDIVFEVFGSFCSQGMDQSLLDPIRIIHQVIHLTGVVVLAAYSAALISSLAVKTFVMPFTTMDGLLQDGTYRFGVVGDSADSSIFRNTTDRTMEVLINDVLTKEAELPNNYFEGLKRVCQEDNYAFMTMDNAVSQLQPIVNCKLEPLDTIMQSSIAMAVRPRSPYKGIINNNILLIRDSGLLQRLLNSEWIFADNTLDSGWTTVEIGDILPLVLVVLGGTIVSLMILTTEQIIARRMASMMKRKAKRMKSQPRVDTKIRTVATNNLSRF